jgi:hypothetical protein
MKIVNHRAKGLCLCCDEKFLPDHKECKRLFIIHVVSDDKDDNEPTISIHALTGIQPRANKMM